MIQTVDAVAFQKRKAIKEGENDQSGNFEIEILAESALDKVLIFPGKTLMVRNPGIFL